MRWCSQYSYNEVVFSVFLQWGGVLSILTMRWYSHYSLNEVVFSVFLQWGGVLNKFTRFVFPDFHVLAVEGLGYSVLCWGVECVNRRTVRANAAVLLHFKQQRAAGVGQTGRRHLGICHQLGGGEGGGNRLHFQRDGKWNIWEPGARNNVKWIFT